MGIKGNFKNTIRSKWPSCFSNMYYSDLENKKIAIDIIGVIYKYKKTVGEEAWFNIFTSYLDNFTKNNINICLVFEGTSPIEKGREKENRKSEKEKQKCRLDKMRNCRDKLLEDGIVTNDCVDFMAAKHTPSRAVYTFIIEDRIVPELFSFEEVLSSLNNDIEKLEKQATNIAEQDFDLVKQYCNEKGIVWIDATGEAETTCASLCINNFVDYVLSDDSDLIALGCPRILTKQKLCFECFDLKKFLDLSGLTMNQLVDWAILCGTDYNDSIPRVGAVNALKFIIKYGSIEKYLEEAQVEPQAQVNLRFERVRQIFDSSTTIIDISKVSKF